MASQSSSFPLDRSNSNGYPKEYKFKCSQDSVRSFKDPHNPELQIHHAYIPVLEFAHGELPDDVNPRSHENPTGRIPKAIRETLENDPASFHLLNRGVLILAHRCTFDNRTQTLHITIASPETNGVADGATTDRVLRELKEEAQNLKKGEGESNGDGGIPDNLQDAYVHLEIISGDIGERLVPLTRARNTSTQVQEFALENLGGGFDWLRDVIEDSEFKGRVRYRENDPEPVDIRSILGLLTLFHPKWNEATKEPVVAFTSKGQVLTNFQQDAWKPGFLRLKPVVLDILRLSEHIHLDFQPQYNKYKGDAGKSGKLGGRKEVRYVEKGYHLPLSGEKTQYVIPDGWLYPILASFRMLLTFPEGEDATWITPPQAFFDESGWELVGNVAEQSESLGRNPVTVGKSTPLWKQLRNIMELHRLKLEQSQAAANAK